MGHLQDHLVKAILPSGPRSSKKQTVGQAPSIMRTLEPRRLCRVLIPSFLAFVLISSPGCRLTSPRAGNGALVHPRQDIAATLNQFRLRMRALVHPMCGELEQAADAIPACVSLAWTHH